MSTAVAQPDIRVLPVDKCHDSPMNRRHIDDTSADMLELGASIRSKGVLQPGVARPHGDLPDEFEVIAGHRRKHGCVIGEVEHMPFVVRNLTDAEAMEIILTENLQREDLPPLESAEQIVAALEVNGDDAEAIASSCGHTAQWVRRRAAIATNLCTAWKKVAGQKPPVVGKTNEQDARRGLQGYALSAKHLELVACLPQSTQEQLLDNLIHYGGCPTVPQMRIYIRRLECRLADAPWDLADDALVKGRNKPGACTTCPKRKGCRLDLFEDGVETAAEDTCLDEECYSKKLQAQARIVLKQQKVDHKKVIELESQLHSNPNSFYVSGSYERYTKCSEKAKGAVRAVVTEGPLAATALWVKKETYGHSSSSNGSGKKAPEQSVEEKRADLKRKRTKYALQQLSSQLSTHSYGQQEAVDVAAVTSNMELMHVLGLWAALDDRLNRGSTLKHINAVIKKGADLDAAELYLRTRLVDLIDSVATRDAHGYPGPDAEKIAAKLTGLLHGVDFSVHVKAAAEKYPEPASWSKTAPAKKKAKPKAKKKAAAKKPSTKAKSKTGKTEQVSA